MEMGGLGSKRTAEVVGPFSHKPTAEAAQQRKKKKKKTATIGNHRLGKYRQKQEPLYIPDDYI